MSTTPNKALTEPSYGTPNWDVILNDNFTILDNTLGSKKQITVTSITSSPIVLAAADYQNMVIEFIGVLSANLTYQIPSGVGGQWIVRNATSGNFTLTIANVAGGASVIVDQGSIVTTYSDGTNIRAADIPGASTNVIFNDGDLRLNGESYFTFNKSADSIVVRGSKSISGISWSSGTATITLSASIEEDISTTSGKVTISGVSPSGYNGVWSIVSLVGGSTTITCTIPNNPGAYVSGGTIYYGQVVTNAISLGGSYVTATAAQINDAGDDGKSYVGATVAFTSASLKTFAHGLGARPNFIQIYLKCVVADAGYSIGDIIYPSPNSSTSTNDRFNSIYADDTNVYVRLSNLANCFIFGNKATGVMTSLVNASWEIGVSAHL